MPPRGVLRVLVDLLPAGDVLAREDFFDRDELPGEGVAGELDAFGEGVEVGCGAGGGVEVVECDGGDVEGV